MANRRLDGTEAEHKGGRPSKAETMGLERRLREAFDAVTGNKGEYEGATEVLKLMWSKALDKDDSKQFDAIKWITDRYYGKEPKQIIIDGEIEHDAAESLQNFINQAINDKTKPEVD